MNIPISSFIAGLKPELEVRDGSFLELRVQVKGDPDPQITWTKDGKPLSSSEILEVKYKNGVGTVTVKETFPEDCGKYSCKGRYLYDVRIVRGVGVAKKKMK